MGISVIDRLVKAHANVIAISGAEGRDGQRVWFGFGFGGQKGCCGCVSVGWAVWLAVYQWWSWTYGGSSILHRVLREAGFGRGGLEGSFLAGETVHVEEKGRLVTERH
jgi:hypothetical protein